LAIDGAPTTVLGDISVNNSANFNPRAAIEDVDTVDAATEYPVGWNRSEYGETIQRRE